jgi:hypothetical protein
MFNSHPVTPRSSWTFGVAGPVEQPGNHAVIRSQTRVFVGSQDQVFSYLTEASFLLLGLILAEQIGLSALANPPSCGEMIL